jgi:hypothetical protein
MTGGMMRVLSEGIEKIVENGLQVYLNMKY